MTTPERVSFDSGQTKPHRPRSAVGMRAGWGLADQMVSSLTNAGLSIMIARAVDADSFGAFGVAFAVFSFTLGASRAIVSDPLVIRYSSADAGALRAAVSRATGLVLVFGAAVGAAVFAASTALGGTVAVSLRALALVLPGLLLQDSWRYAFLARGRPRAALVNDLVWGVTQFALIGLLVTARAQTVSLLVLAWGGAGLAGAAFGLAQAKVLPRPGRALAWLREHRDLAPLLVLEYTITLGVFNAALFMIGVLSGLSDVGAIRAAQVLLGPIQVLFLGAAAITVPEFSRRTDRNSAVLTRDAAVVSGVLACAATAWLLVLLLLPDSVGIAVLGDSWPGARRTLPYVGLMLISIGSNAGPYLMLRALGAGRRVLQASALQAPLTLVFGVTGAVVASAPGAAAGFAVAHWFGTGLWWISLRIQLRIHSGDSTPS